ncbi:MAG: DUF885 domain-containing protein [Chloroflexi bacterium]|nr:MAG: DUF885 domain-containing protein [Chloroflexota bacterium]
MTVAPAADALRHLADEYWEGVLRRNPVLATFLGDYRYNDRLPDVGPRRRAEEEADLRAVLSGLQPLAAVPFDIEDRITWDMLRLAIQTGLDALRLRLDEMSVDQMDGPQVWLLELLNWHPTDTPEHVQQLIARYRAFDRYMDQYLDALRDGIKDARTAPTIAVERVIAQLRALLGTPVDESPLLSPAATQPEPLARGMREAVVEVVYPAFQRMLDFLADYLTRHARRDPGVWAVADGDEIYSLLARQHTTTELSPDELHQMGADDLAEIHREMRAIMNRRGAPATSLRGFTEQLTRDPANLPSGRDELIQIAEQLLATAGAALPRAFGRLPRMPIVVMPIEPYRERDAPAAFYFQGSEDGSRPGIFYINTFEPSARPKHTLPALAFHEGVPGHHLQVALAQEAADLPAFRRLSAGWLGNAFVEGWALYTERLADELGLYADELARYGMLGYQAWRACRLVVDTGLHHLRWSRERAIEFFLENVGLTERETFNEVDRYIVWPGQALAYKVGQREIERLRSQQQAALGPRFDLRTFHDDLLRHAAVPLSTLPLLITDSC